MSEMIERVAVAISARLWREDYAGTDDSQRESFIEAARAAIEAMREPTEAMKLAPPDMNLGKK